MAGEDPPLIAGKIHAIRAWTLAGGHRRPRLGAAFGPDLWTVGGAPTKARCRDERHAAPQGDCTCGLYAVHPWNTVELPGEGIPGVIEAWGRIEVHHDGIRAQYARPICLALPPDSSAETELLVESAASAYGAELVAGGAAALVRYCRERDLGLSRAVVCELVGEREPDGWRPPVRSAAPARRTPPAPAPSGGKLARAGELAGRILMGVAMAVYCLLYAGFWIACGWVVLGAIFGWFPEGEPTAAQLARRHLEIMDERVIHAADGTPVYLARVRNDSERRQAVGVTARLQIYDHGGLPLGDQPGRFDRPAAIPPGETAVIRDRLDQLSPEAWRYDSTLRVRRYAPP